tara:strand:- start:450 stop:668 length:219 start_codon:yes stop_codon:yes gene_type:complete
MFKQTIFIFLLGFSGLASSKINLIESSSGKSGLKTFVSTICIAGYKFVIADGTVQFFIEEKGEIIPAKCETK